MSISKKYVFVINFKQLKLYCIRIDKKRYNFISIIIGQIKSRFYKYLSIAGQMN